MREIGALELPGEEAFGEISDLAVRSDGTIFILDGMSQEIKAFSSEGVFLVSSGRPGKGPGEFTGARALALDKDGAVYVLDERLARVSRFFPSASLSYEKAVLINRHATDFCFLDDRLFLMGNHKDGVIQEMSLDGTPLRAFGRLYEGKNPLLRASLSLGLVLCVAEAELILTVSPVLPVVRAYSPNGSLMWSARLPEFKETIFKENVDGSVTYDVGPDKRYHVLESILHLPQALVLVQGGLRTVGAPQGEYDMIQTWVLSAKDGTVVSSTDSLPLLKHIGQVYGYGVTTDLYPKLVQYRLDELDGE
jgi:hypothetical protein